MVHQNRNMKLFGISLLLMLVCVTCVIMNNSVYAKRISVKNVKIDIGRRYKITCRTKKVKYVCTKKNIASVSKKGVVKALKSGKCVVFVKRKNKVLAKYNIKVVNKKDCISTPNVIVFPSASPVPILSPAPTLSPVPIPSIAPTPPKVNYNPLILNDGVIIEEKNIEEGYYFYIFEFTNKKTLEEMRKCFKECVNVSKVQIKIPHKYEKKLDGVVDIVLNRNDLKYTVIDDSTVEIYKLY